MIMEFEQYEEHDQVFFCKNHKAWRRHNGCKYKIQQKMDGCSYDCLQAKEENIKPTILRRRGK